MSPKSSAKDRKPWRFVTNHTQVLLCIARDPGIRLRDVAHQVGITERAVQRIVAELVEAGFVERRRVGRRNEYVVNREGAMRHPAQVGHAVGELLDLLRPAAEPSEASAGNRERPDRPAALG
jgi:predicted ArsR family transcriptional regulator